MSSKNSESISRRAFLVAGAATLPLAGCATNGFFSKKKEPKMKVGLQLYSVREDCAKNLPGTIEAVAKMGYMGVEFAGYYDRSAKEIRQMLDDNGIVCCGTHTALDTLLGDNLPKTIEYNKTLGNKYLIVPSLPNQYRSSQQAWRDTAKLFNELAEKVNPHRMLVGYHNHSVEFKPMEGEIPWDTFCANTGENVVLQLDVGNAMNGGGDPLQYLYKYPGRAATVHVKEFSKTNDKALIGEGDINWKAFFAICEAVGNTDWYIVEHESYAYPPLECVQRCLHNLRKMKLIS
jgi:sugar phosphate isomerase/epimerase